jgi:hypothetical protein
VPGRGVGRLGPHPSERRLDASLAGPPVAAGGWRFDTGRPVDTFLGPFHAVGDGVVYAGVKNGIVALISGE